MKVAVAWLRKEDWPRWQAIDDQLPPYSRWLEKIEGAMAVLKGKGQAFEKVDVDPDLFVKWCEESRKPIHRDSRAAYAATVLMKRGEH